MITKDELQAHVGHLVSVQLTRSRATDRLRTANGHMDAIREDGMSVIDRNNRERRVSYSEVAYWGCSTDGGHWPTDPTPAQIGAGQEVVDNLYWFLVDSGQSMSCREAEAMAGLFRAFDKPALADAIVMAHASGDDDAEDDHYGTAVDGLFTDEGFQPGNLPRAGLAGRTKSLTVIVH